MGRRIERWQGGGGGGGEREGGEKEREREEGRRGGEREGGGGGGRRGKGEGGGGGGWEGEREEETAVGVYCNAAKRINVFEMFSAKHCLTLNPMTQYARSFLRILKRHEQ